MGRHWRLPPFKVRKTCTASEMKQVIPWGLKLNGIDQLHLQTQGEGVRVALLDTGIDDAHPDLKDRIAAMKDFSGSAWGTRDQQGHGTHTAGTIAADDNGVGVVGVASKCSLLVGKVLGDDGSGSMEAVADGIRWAIAQKAQIISMSLGSPDADDGVLAAIQEAVKAGIFVVCAAGNEGHLVDKITRQDINTVDYPGKWTELCSCVGAHDESGKIAEFSSRGPEVDFLAPGVNVASCWPGGRYAYLDGTSMATPFMAGTAALLIAYRKAKGYEPITSQAMLEALVSVKAIPAKDYGAGHGLLRVGDAFQNMLPPAVVPAPAVDPKVIEHVTAVGVIGGYSIETILRATPVHS